ncbi:iron chelate uptake ABC transporter family permease subunit [Hoyosella rhizosphaerae]|uniref:Iron ABC transporter permease n=1 Tax=Hoyosella rhizosphaerae TaxID=1755582 RepID=A0A916U9M3_9ACTN|nr:iron chelate uptake ABC transporter family permease subunit [Hoyosella rhizosphaerae]MBN4927607.1 iron chelate uptake ABC transporter family permease subunit [Hoyosella rhizosphaerae]GGC63128.1 iron ABC transporter permease [Hoyosella rhizosphaerae]
MSVLPRGTAVIRSRGTTFRVHKRSVVIAAALLVAVAGFSLWSLTLGKYGLTASQVVDILQGGGNLIERDVIIGTRLPRVLVAVLAGAAFAMSGAILQRIAANPLVSPDVIGINTGAALGALVVLTIIGGSALSTIVGALVGALTTIGLILLIANKHGISGYRLVLVGIGMTAMLSSLISFILTRANIYEAHNAAVWLTGSLANRGWLHVSIIGTTLVLALPFLVVWGRNLSLLELGDELASTLSGNAAQHRINLTVLACVLAAMATAAAGPIGFVALVAPQIVRRLLHERSPGLVPSAAAGALLIVTADLAARTLFPTELPVGVLTAVLGAPVLIYLLARASKIGHAG